MKPGQTICMVLTLSLFLASFRIVNGQRAPPGGHAVPSDASPPVCEDQTSSKTCREWKDKGDCNNYQQFMKNQCEKTCGFC